MIIDGLSIRSTRRRRRSKAVTDFLFRPTQRSTWLLLLSVGRFSFRCLSEINGSFVGKRLEKNVTTKKQASPMTMKMSIASPRVVTLLIGAAVSPHTPMHFAVLSHRPKDLVEDIARRCFSDNVGQLDSPCQNDTSANKLKTDDIVELFPRTRCIGLWAQYARCQLQRHALSTRLSSDLPEFLRHLKSSAVRHHEQLSSPWIRNQQCH